MQLVMWIIFKPYRRRRHPFGMLLCNALLGNAVKPKFLPLPQLRDQGPVTLRIDNDGFAEYLAPGAAFNHQVSRVHLHDLIARALCREAEADTALVARLLAIAITCVVE